MKKLIYQGSVKEIYDLGKKVEFKFTDAYSIFDWGKMPDFIPKKGKYLAKIASNLFSYLEDPKTFQELKIPTYLSESQQLKKTFQLEQLKTYGAQTHFIKQSAIDSITVDKYNVMSPLKNGFQYDYSKYQIHPTKTLIPLEIVFRFGAPQGSSFLERNQEITADTTLDQIHIEFYTKLEPEDRVLSIDEASKMAKLTRKELEDISILTKLYAIALKEKFDSIEMKLWDGKFEFGFGDNIDGNREIILLDSIGPDELRLTQNNIHYSKEYLRTYYRKTNWYMDFKHNKLHKIDPPKLPQKEIKVAKYLYKKIALSLETSSIYNKKEYEIYLKENNKCVVILGSGAREHAIAMHLALDNQISKIILIPGNSGIIHPKIICRETENILKETIEIDPSFILIGPENLIADGTGDQLKQLGFNVMAPTKEMARLESSKLYAKKFMQKNDIPTAQYHEATDREKAKEIIQKLDWERFVIKQSGLAAGKGVFICHSKKEAIESLEYIPREEEILIEQMLYGPEVSYFILCLNGSYKVLGTACDYKRLQNYNEGPNTGGMGAYSPAYWLTVDEEEEIIQKIVEPTIKSAKNYKGVLFIGIMMTKDGPMLLEYNCRFGDPETQAIIPRLERSLAPLFQAIAEEKDQEFKKFQIEIKNQISMNIVKASHGYPGLNNTPIDKDKKIKNVFHSNEKSHLYFAGVKGSKKQLYTNGGRVLGVTSLGSDINEVRLTAYKKLKEISFEGEHYREDIGL